LGIRPQAPTIQVDLQVYEANITPKVILHSIQFYKINKKVTNNKLLSFARIILSSHESTISPR